MREFVATRNIQNYVSSIEAEMGMKGQMMCVEQLHILDVISRASSSSKCIQIVEG